MAGEVWDAPNQQVVRPDASAPWEEGNGGSQNPEPKDDEPLTLDEMTKAQLLNYAAQHDIDVDDSMSKADIRAAIGDG
jgi:hypothetical protein